MTGNIAALVCTVLIIGLFILHLRRKSSSSPGVWLPTFWLILSASRVPTSWFNSQGPTGYEIDYLAGDPINRMILFILMILGLILVLRRRIDAQALISQNRWIFVLLLYALISTLWSPYEGVSIKRWFRLTGDVLMAVIILTEKDSAEAMKDVIARGAYFLIPISILLIKYFPEFGKQYSMNGQVTYWLGITGQKNNLGILASIVGVFYLIKMFGSWHGNSTFIEKIVDVAILIMSLWLLLGNSLSRSATSIAVFAIGILVYCWLAMLRNHKRSVGGAMLYITAFAIAVLFATQAIGQYTNAFGRDMTFTGRTLIWQQLMQIGSRHPVQGLGYGSLWIGDVNKNLLDQFYELGQGHNSYIDIYVELGLSGVFLLGCAILSVYRNILKTVVAKYEGAIFRITFLAIILVQSITESTLLKPGNLMWYLFLIIGMQYMKEGSTNADREYKLESKNVVSDAKSARSLFEG